MKTPSFRTLLVPAGALFLLLWIGLSRTWTADLWAQTPPPEDRIETLKNQIQESEREIQQLPETQRETLSSSTYYERQLRLREQLVNTYSAQVSRLMLRQDSLMANIGRMQQVLALHQTQYQSRIVHLYKHGRMQDWVLILSSKSVNEFLVRLYYLRLFSQQRNQQYLRMKEAEVRLKSEVESSQQTLNHIQRILQATHQEKNVMEQLMRKHTIKPTAAQP